MKFSPAGIFIIGLGLVIGVAIWVVGYFGLPNQDTHRVLSKNPPIQTSVQNSASQNATGGSATGNATGGTSGAAGGTGSSSGGSSSTGASGKPDIQAGQVIFQNQCSTCHGANGEGGAGPALWGSKSALQGTNMTQLSNLVSFVKSNMPLTAPGSLSQQDALNVSGFILSHK